MGIIGSVVVVIVALNIRHQSLGQSLGCTTALISLSPCLNFVTGSSSNSSTPSSSCCSRLANVVQSQPQCLCSALNGGAAGGGVTINPTRALALPAACHLQTPPPSRCNDVSGSMARTTSPVSSPESSPTESFDDKEVVETPTTTTWEGSNFGSATASSSVPTTEGNPSNNGLSLISTPFYLIINGGVLLTALLI
ncbi:non-specific lipid-transfer protein-like protein At2g13820 [Momordica charantia]|uniref:Non-specific lipid-transfer protein-like protein At2g13820 n=1 Tax=Momordica charantia TaxID=3673 RepID=A0A6J1CYC7_MOMCH|nr:non-specific lipid-transfer protein-like protein At2g13820 [Momordica charantia]